jgi:hypothetical protein
LAAEQGIGPWAPVLVERTLCEPHADPVFLLGPYGSLVATAVAVSAGGAVLSINVGPCQAGEGWRLLPDRYDDRGLSGASLDRPALQALLVEVRACRIDVVVVYKDRLTRSLADFAKLIELVRCPCGVLRLGDAILQPRVPDPILPFDVQQYRTLENPIVETDSVAGHIGFELRCAK